jgi:hypothetical protein
VEERWPRVESTDDLEGACHTVCLLAPAAHRSQTLEGRLEVKAYCHRSGRGRPLGANGFHASTPKRVCGV